MHSNDRAGTESGGEGAGRRVLVVDDDPNVLRTVAKLLTAEGYEVITASDGAEALAQAQEVLPDAIVLDLILPSVEQGAGQFDGFGVMKWLEVRLPKAVPVIVLTGRPDEATRREAEALGATAFLAKPIKPRELLAAVRDAIA